MGDFYARALKKLDKLTAEQCRELLVSAAGEINRLETVLDSIPVGILVCDEKHSLLMANKSAKRLLPMKYTPGEAIWTAVLEPQQGPSYPGTNWSEESSVDDRITEFLKTSILNGERVLEKEMDITLKGQNRLLAVSVLPLVRNSRVTGSLIYIEDITEKRGREVRLRQAENLASLTTLAAGVAHEIKNPLGSISIHLQLLQKKLSKNRGAKKEDNALFDKYFAVLNEEVDRLNHIVVDFLFAVRPMALELREGDINALITELCEFMGPEMEQANIRVLPELAENLPPLLFDARYMKQALLNLFKNAQAAMNQGGLLTIATMPVDNTIRITVCDTGAGISEANVAKIFDPYFSTKESGTGLGLTLVYKIIREHQGEIAVDSREGEGTAFVITLPARQKERRLIEYNGKGSEHEIQTPGN